MSMRQNVDVRRTTSRARVAALVVGVFALALMCVTANNSSTPGTASDHSAHGVVTAMAADDLHQTAPACDNCADHPEHVWTACILVMAVALVAQVGAPCVLASTRVIRARTTAMREVLSVLNRTPNLYALSVSRT